MICALNHSHDFRTERYNMTDIGLLDKRLYSFSTYNVLFFSLIIQSYENINSYAFELFTEIHINDEIAIFDGSPIRR